MSVWVDEEEEGNTSVIAVGSVFKVGMRTRLLKRVHSCSYCDSCVSTFATQGFI